MPRNVNSNAKVVLAAMILLFAGCNCSKKSTSAIDHDQLLRSLLKHFLVNSPTIFRYWDVHDVQHPQMNPVFVNTRFEKKSNVFDEYVRYLNKSDSYSFVAIELQTDIDTSRFLGYNIYYNKIDPKRISERHFDSLAIASGVELNIPRYLAIPNLVMDLNNKIGAVEVKTIGHSGRTSFYFFYFDGKESVILEAIEEDEFVSRLSTLKMLDKSTSE